MSDTVLNQMGLMPGCVVKHPGSWQDYESLAQQRGDHSIPRIKYRNGEILLMAPLPEHGKSASVIANIVEALLDRQERDYDSFTPITMKLPEQGGIEPDYCFYINRWESVQGMRRIDWQQQPPPDLVIEVDVTSYSEVNDYLLYQVPEVWLLKSDELQIYQLKGRLYVVSQASQYFPDIDLHRVVRECLSIAYSRNASAAIRHLRANF